jgi:hypothetical protein
MDPGSSSGPPPKARRNPLIPERLKGDERQKALEEPGPSWKEWALTSGLKGYVVFGLLLLDALLLVSFEEAPGDWKWGALAVLPFLLYANFLILAYLWAKPPDPHGPRKKFAPSLRHPFLVGRWHPDRAKALSRERSFGAEGDVHPEEFV